MLDADTRWKREWRGPARKSKGTCVLVVFLTRTWGNEGGEKENKGREEGVGALSHPTDARKINSGCRKK